MTQQLQGKVLLIESDVVVIAALQAQKNLGLIRRINNSLFYRR
jgi:hypothetical protein